VSENFGYSARPCVTTGALITQSIGREVAVHHQQFDDNICATVAMLNAVSLTGARELAQEMSAGKKLTPKEVRKKAHANGLEVCGMKCWYLNHKTDPTHKNGMAWLLANPEASAKKPIAIILNLENGKKKHAVTILDGLCYDPNNKFTAPFDRAHIDKKYTGVTEGFQFSITEKAANKKRV
jgi:hypothetical protein